MVYIIGENGSGYTPIQITKAGVPVVFNGSNVFKPGDSSASSQNSSQSTVWSQQYSAKDLASKANSGEQLTDEEQRFLEARGYSQKAGTRTVYTKKHYDGGLFDAAGNYTGNGRYSYYDSLESGSNVVSSRQEQYTLWEHADNPDSLTTGQKVDKISQSLQAGIISNPAYQKVSVSLSDLNRWGSEGLEESSGEIKYSGLSQLSAKAPGYINPFIGGAVDWTENTFRQSALLSPTLADNFLLDSLSVLGTGLQNTITQGSYIIPGVETFIKQPATIGYSLALIPETIYGTAKYAIDDPVQFTGDMLVGAALGHIAVKGLGKISERLPAISRTSTPQEILLKSEVPTSPKIATEGIKYTEAEYTGSFSGNDFFKVSEKIQGDLISVPEKGPTIDVLVGKETKAGTQEVYFKLTDNQARTIGENFYVKSRNINIEGKSYLELTPLERIERPGFIKTELIGEKLLLNEKNKPSIRLESKVKAIEGELEFKQLEQRLQLPEYTQETTIKAKSETGTVDRVVYDPSEPTLKSLPEYGSFDAEINPEQVASAKAVSTSLRVGDESKLIEAYEPVFNEKGISIARGDWDLKIVPDSEWKSIQIGEYTGLPDELSGVAVRQADAVSKPTLFLRESSSEFYDPNTFSHELGHLFGKGGSFGSGKLTSIIREAVAEKTAQTLPFTFEEKYGFGPGEGWGAFSLSQLGKAIIDNPKVSIPAILADPGHTIGFALSDYIPLSFNRVPAPLEVNAERVKPKEILKNNIVDNIEKNFIKQIDSDSTKWLSDEDFYVRTGTSPGTDTIAQNTARNKLMFEQQDLNSNILGETAQNDILAKLEADNAQWLQDEGINPKSDLSPQEKWLADEDSYMRTGTSPGTDTIAQNTARNKLMFEQQDLNSNVIGKSTQNDILSRLEADNARWMQDEGLEGPITPNFEPLKATEAPKTLDEINKASWLVDEDLYMKSGTSPGTDRIAQNTARNKLMFEQQDLNSNILGETAQNDILAKLEADNAKWLQDEGLEGPIVPKFKPMGATEAAKIREAKITDLEFSTAPKYSPTDFELKSSKGGSFEEVTTDKGLVLLKPLEKIEKVSEADLIAQFDFGQAKWLADEKAYQKIAEQVIEPESKRGLMLPVSGGSDTSSLITGFIPETPKRSPGYRGLTVLPVAVQIPTNKPRDPVQLPVNIPVQIPQLPVNIPVQIPQLPVNIPVQIPQLPVNIPVQIPQLPVNIPVQIPQLPVNIPVQIPQLPVNIPTYTPDPTIPTWPTNSQITTPTVIQTKRIHIIDSVPLLFPQSKTTPPPFDIEERAKSQAFNPDLRAATDARKFNKFYNPLQSTAGLDSQLTKLFRRRGL